MNRPSLRSEPQSTRIITPFTTVLSTAQTQAIWYQTPLSESIGQDGVDHFVSTNLTGLTPGTTYHFRVVAVNLNGRTAGPDETLSIPITPTVSASSASALSQTAATLSAAIQARVSAHQLSL